MKRCYIIYIWKGELLTASGEQKGKVSIDIKSIARLAMSHKHSSLEKLSNEQPSAVALNTFETFSKSAMVITDNHHSILGRCGG